MKIYCKRTVKKIKLKNIVLPSDDGILPSDGMLVNWPHRSLHLALARRRYPGKSRWLDQTPTAARSGAQSWRIHYSAVQETALSAAGPARLVWKGARHGGIPSCYFKVLKLLQRSAKKWGSMRIGECLLSPPPVPNGHSRRGNSWEAHAKIYALLSKLGGCIFP